MHGPSQDRFARELCAVVTHNDVRFTACGEQLVELPSDAGAGNRCVGDQRQTFSGTVVDPATMRRRRHRGTGLNAKSTDERWLGAWGTIIGARVPKAGLRAPRRRTPSRSSLHNRLWFTMWRSCFKSTCSRQQPNRRRAWARVVFIARFPWAERAISKAWGHPIAEPWTARKAGRGNQYYEHDKEEVAWGKSGHRSATGWQMSPMAPLRSA
jgi:hypothetical protein